MISNVHMRLIFKVSDDSCFDYPKYKTIDIPMSDRMIDITGDPATACACSSATTFAMELQRARAEIARLRQGYAECIDHLMHLADHEVYGAAQGIVSSAQRHRDILKGSD